jgi:spore coat polysaccharide biosynthesis protein SpsF (cytidylyltransferase family)
VSKRTESIDRIAQALDAFIVELTTDGESSTPASTQNETTARLVDKPRLDSEVVKQSAQIRLWLRVENNNKFIRRKKKVREHIERFCLSFYNAQKTTPNGCEYIITIPYENDEDLDKQVYDLFQDMDSHADMDYCFIEVDAHEIGTDRSW